MVFGGSFFSLALLTKYNAVLLGAGVLAYTLHYKKEIGGPSFGHIVVSTLIIFLIQTPVLLWNLSNDFASFSFHLGERLDQGKSFQNVVGNVAGFIGSTFSLFTNLYIQLEEQLFFD